MLPEYEQQSQSQLSRNPQCPLRPMLRHGPRGMQYAQRSNADLL
jgi:hypothetical protein